MAVLPITITLKAHDWTGAVRQLLKGFNKVE
jgi:hypothetical protein